MLGKNMVLIPVRNCQGMIGNVLEEIYPSLQFIDATVVVMDNASDDGTLDEIYEKIGELENLDESRFTILKNPINIGYGASIKKLFDFAVDKNVEVIYLIHGDDQSNWGEVLKQLRETLLSDEWEIVMCSRFLKSSRVDKYSIKRKIGNYFFKYLTNLITGLNMSDPGAAVMVFRSKILLNIDYSELDSGYMFHPQFNIILFSSQLSIKEIPIVWKNASKSEGLNLLYYGTKLFLFLIKVSFWRHFKNVSWEVAVKAR